MKKKILVSSLLICSLLLMSCSNKETVTSIENEVEPDLTESNQINSEITLEDESTATSSMTLHGTRDNTPVCLVPVASGVTVYSNQLAAIDASNTSEGYIMVNYTGNNSKVKLRITGPDANIYTYNLYKNGYESFPLSSGSGTYTVTVYENIKDTSYSTALSQTIHVNITNVFGPNLYPNQYVKFNKDSKVISKAQILTQNSTSDLDVVTKVYNFCATNITYDYNKASSVQSGYTSNIDAILESGTGICLDYAAVMASMLRSQGIPTRLEVGYAGTAYHAWISTYIAEIGWVNGMIEFDGTSWSLMDPTFASTTDEKVLKNFIGDGTNYKVKYIY